MIDVNFNEFLQYPLCGIYALVNSTDGKVGVFYAKNILSSLVKHMKDIQENIHPIKGLITDKDKLEYKLLEVIPDPINLYLKHGEWHSKYADEGWKLYNKRKPTKYTLLSTIEQYHIVVYLKGQSGSRTIVGVFGKVNESEEFIKNFYPDRNKVRQVIFCNNKETKKYYKNLNERQDQQQVL
jgi:hypothetical protein